MTCPRCAAVNQPGASICATCQSPLPLAASAQEPPSGSPPPAPGGYPPGYAPQGQPGYPPQPGYYPPQGYGQGYPPPYGYAPYGAYPQPPRSSGMAIAGFVVSLIFCGVLGLVLSIMGNNEVKRSGGTVTGGGLAMAGIIIGIVRIVIEVIYIVLIVAAVGGNAHIG